MVLMFFLFPLISFADEIQFALVSSPNYAAPVEQPYLVQWQGFSGSYHTFLREFAAATTLYEKLNDQLRLGEITIRGGVPGWLELNDKFIVLYEAHN